MHLFLLPLWIQVLVSVLLSLRQLGLDQSIKVFQKDILHPKLSFESNQEVTALVKLGRVSQG